MKKHFWMGLALLGAIALSGCHSTTVVVVYEQPWYDVYGRHCGYGEPRPGCNFYSDGRKISAGHDPYYAHRSYSYGLWGYYDSYGRYREFIGWGWQSPTGILYDSHGRALNEEQERQSRDVIADAAEDEARLVQAVGRSFAQQFALAESTGIRIAETLSQMATLPKRLNRARTQADIEAFTERLYGVNLSAAMEAAQRAQGGDLAALRAMNEQVAAHWGTQPETSEAILRNWYRSILE